MIGDSFSEIEARIAARTKVGREMLEVLTELLGECDILGEYTEINAPNQSPWLLYKKYGIKIEPTSVPSEGWWVIQYWRHPKNRGYVFNPDVQHTQLVKASESSSLRSIVLDRASIVEEILSKDPIRWHHDRFSFGTLTLLALAVWVVVIGSIVLSP
jgi:hypothetical protein